MPDYNFLMETRLRPEQLRAVNSLGRLAASHGLNLYLAGTAVLDLTLGAAQVRDLSFIAEGNIQKMLRPLASRAGKRSSGRSGAADDFKAAVLSVRQDSKVNRGEVRFEGGVQAEIAATRKEIYGAPGRPPAASPGTVFDDLRRRDFSANAMAISLHPNSRGLLLDPTNGASDIERRELRALHSRSFFDDPARIYRLFRLSLRLNFEPDEKTSRWLGMALDEKTWEALSNEQQGRELRAILEEETCGRILKLLGERGLLGGLDRKLGSARIDFGKFDRIRTAVHTAAAEDDAFVLNFQALVANLPGADQNRLAEKVLADSKTIQLALSLDREASKLAKLLGGAQAARPSEVYALLSRAPRPVVVFLQAHHHQATVQNRVKSFFTKFPAIRAALPRTELESLGLPPGPKFEKVLEQIFAAELDGKIKTPQQRTQALQDYSGIKVQPPPPAPAPKAPPEKVRAGKAKSTGAAPKGQAAKAPAQPAEKPLAAGSERRMEQPEAGVVSGTKRVTKPAGHEAAPQPTKAKAAKGGAERPTTGKPSGTIKAKSAKPVKPLIVKGLKSAVAMPPAKKPKPAKPAKSAATRSPAKRPKAAPIKAKKSRPSKPKGKRR